MADIRNDQQTTATLAGPGATLTGEIEVPGDTDMVKVDLVAGTSYVFKLQIPEVPATFTPTADLILFDSNLGPAGYSGTIHFTPDHSGTYFLSAGMTGAGLDRLTGAYTLSVELDPAPPGDVKGGTQTTASILGGGQIEGSVDFGGDQDWYRITLQAGQSYQFSLLGKNYHGETQWGTLDDPFLSLHDAQGAWMASNDDQSGVFQGELFDRKSELVFTPPETGAYYLSAAGWANAVGSYTLLAQAVAVAFDVDTSGDSYYVLQPGTPFKSTIADDGETADVLHAFLIAGNDYTFAMNSLSAVDARLAIAQRADPLTALASAQDTGSNNAVLRFTPAETGPYLLSAGRAGTGSGAYEVVMTHAPGLNPQSQTFVAVSNAATPFSIVPSDGDADALTYAAAEPRHGTVTVGTGGQFTYVSDFGFLGVDDITISVSDANGGTATQSFVVTVTPPPVDDFRLFTGSGFAGEVGGSGTVFGTAGFQDIAVADLPGSIAFDASFNRGGDLVHLHGNGTDWSVIQSGSNAVFSDGDTFLVIPVGTAGMVLQFDDGASSLRYDSGAGIVKIGEQSVTESQIPFYGSNVDAPLPTGEIPDASARLFLSGGASVTVGGIVLVFGTTGAEEVTVTQGEVVLDASFNKGGDVLVLDQPASGFFASYSGSNVLLDSASVDLAVPVGTSGLTLSFAGDERILVYDTAIASILIDTQPISASPAALVGFG